MRFLAACLTIAVVSTTVPVIAKVHSSFGTSSANVVAPNSPSPNKYDKLKFSTYRSALHEVDKDSSGPNVTIDICEDGKIISVVKLNKRFAEKLMELGSGQGEDGQWYNVVEGKSDKFPKGCFAKTNGPLGDEGGPLTVFTSVATKKFPLGTILHIEQLNGTALNNGKTHDGFVKVTGKNADDGNINLWVFSAVPQDHYFNKLPEFVHVKKVENGGISIYDLPPASEGKC
ncbi:hypothetical protein IWQ61_007150 [Dispira simplex]|nr:hypothetical protein IWQ61_007150 [Dispira simplex]